MPLFGEPQEIFSSETRLKVLVDDLQKRVEELEIGHKLHEIAIDRFLDGEIEKVDLPDNDLDTTIECVDARITICWKDSATHERKCFLTKLICLATNKYSEKV